MDLLKQPYEISLWDDRIVYVGESGEEYSDITTAKEPIINQYFKEIKICTIGSNAMDSPARCIKPKLAQKINGENTLTFSIYYSYTDPITGQKEHNPFLGFLVNERKVKLRLGPVAETETDERCQWYDFIIKNIQEKSDSKEFSYTCKDQFVNELSKTGFEIELDNELENNMGTADQLGETILEGSDWKIEAGDQLKQYKEEPLYEVKLNALPLAYNLENEEDKITLNDIKDKTIYVFYSNITEKKNQWQFLCLNTDEIDFKVDDDLIIDKLYKNYIISVEYDSEATATISWPSFVDMSTGDPKISKYRGNKLIRQYQTQYDPTIDRYVGIYKKDGDEKEYRGFTETEYVTAGGVVNYVVNSECFTNTSGWSSDGHNLPISFTAEKEGEVYHSYLTITNKQAIGNDYPWVLNSGIANNRSAINGFNIGEQYVIRIKMKEDNLPSIRIYSYEMDGQNFSFLKPDNAIFDFSKENSKIDKPDTNKLNAEGNYDDSDDGYTYLIASCNESISTSILKSGDPKIGLFFQFGNNNSTFHIESVELFKYETFVDENETTRMCVPGGKAHSEIRTKYIYYEKDDSLKSIEDLVPVYSSYTNDLSFIQQYKDGDSQFTKIRSISEKESNRFNLIQSVCETFECWPQFIIKRNQKTGQIYYGKDINPNSDKQEPFEADNPFRQQKFLRFKEYVDQPNPVCFRYGVNSKSIQRTIDSAQVVSKMIVKDNANEFAPNGFCSIARASESLNGENFLLNFDHYIRNQLLDPNTVRNDLYEISLNGSLGYYYKLKNINKDRDVKIDIQSGLVIDISNYEANYTTYKTSYDSAVEERNIILSDTSKYTGIANLTNDNFYDTISYMIATSHSTDSKLNQYLTKWCTYTNIINQHGTLYQNAERNLQSATEQYEEIEEYLKNITSQKKALALQFYKKYSRFIQEGSWIKEDYVDPNLYYLDAESTLHTSAQPKVTYNISVIDVSPLAVQSEYKDFEHYKFKLGDRTYIEDTEFFGWSLIDGTTPYREEIIVSEITTELDSPEKNQIKVQNYKTQFEDLFQRITASTQQAEYHTGEYNRATSIVQADGSISPETLETSFLNNTLALTNARDQSVTWDENGLRTTSLSNPSEVVRMISGGIFLSTDGGQTWKTGITGSGINTSYLTSGQINTNKIYIMNGNNTAFRWDEKGISAYFHQEVGPDENKIDVYDSSKFVRFDHNGIYGILAGDDWSGNDDEIHNSASFALTWSGFSLRNTDGSVRISTENDIQVLQSIEQEQNSQVIERIKIGRLEGDTSSYGIRIRNSNNAIVMETDDKGELWLRNTLYVGEKGSKVEIGKLSETRGKTGKHEIIHAGDASKQESPFIVYEDGYVIADYIEVKGGKIGGMDVTKIESVGYEVIIVSDKGTAVTEGSQITLTAYLYHNGEEYKGTNIQYQWYVNNEAQPGETKQELKIDSINLGEDGYEQYRCMITVS